MPRFPLRCAATFARLLSLAVVLAMVFVTQPACGAKNIILMVADGAGYNTWLAASMYRGKVGGEVFDQPGWIKLSCSTYPLTLSGKPSGDSRQDSALVYNAAKAWDSSRKDPKLATFAGYYYLVKTCTDSAAAATALATGRKTYNGAINWSNDDRPMRGQTIAEIAKAQGKSAGVITTVPWSHATPAGLGGAHNRSRNNYTAIANEMLDAPWLDVIMGAGHPNFDDNGRPLANGKKPDYRYVGGEKTWSELRAGHREWKLVESKADFEALATGATPPKVLGTARVASTLQESRARGQTVLRSIAEGPGEPFADPPNADVPSLAVMTRAALNCLDDNPHGFFLMIEGGAVDWANHSNEPDRMIEEQVGFIKAVEAVVAWVDAHSSWDDTLLILTADHECGLLWGENSSKVAFQPIADRGPGKLPGMKYNSHGHSNSLVPLYARGAGSQRLLALLKGVDRAAATNWHCPGDCIDNTDIFAIMRAEVQ